METGDEVAEPNRQSSRTLIGCPDALILHQVPKILAVDMTSLSNTSYWLCDAGCTFLGGSKYQAVADT
ncbi:hypothetical protein PFLUV_G00004050 [Perca fluviatilis]|uniref:Uncharacterized protein n=1 Tax=Perca fluviatilis TaxID=8168 RepID=A0A6A5EXT7_PERFL|nr:hypothetical protein PFLUV_G00004050 [Perca fluviatilis]